MTTPPDPAAEDYPVTVCDHCLRASCWHAEFTCAKYLSAGTVERMASQLRALNLEHPSYYSRERLLRITGGPK